MRDYKQEQFIHELEKAAQKLRCGDWEALEEYMYQYHLKQIKAIRLPAHAEAEACKAVAIEAMKFYFGSPDAMRFLLSNMGCRKMAIWLMVHRSMPNVTLTKLSEDMESDDVDRLMLRFSELNLSVNEPTGPGAEDSASSDPPTASEGDSGGSTSTAP